MKFPDYPTGTRVVVQRDFGTGRREARHGVVLDDRPWALDDAPGTPAQRHTIPNGVVRTHGRPDDDGTCLLIRTDAGTVLPEDIAHVALAPAPFPEDVTP